jgi:hypothetical protein
MAMVGVAARHKLAHGRVMPGGPSAAPPSEAPTTALHPGPDIDAHAAAALAGSTVTVARRHLDNLKPAVDIMRQRGTIANHDSRSSHS